MQVMSVLDNAQVTESAPTSLPLYQVFVGACLLIIEASMLMPWYRIEVFPGAHRNNTGLTSAGVPTLVLFVQSLALMALARSIRAGGRRSPWLGRFSGTLAILGVLALLFRSEVGDYRLSFPELPIGFRKSSWSPWDNRMFAYFTETKWGLAYGALFACLACLGVALISIKGPHDPGLGRMINIGRWGIAIIARILAVVALVNFLSLSAGTALRLYSLIDQF
jgi:hypothetical protein